MAKYFLGVFVLLCNPAYAFLKDCSAYPLITYAEREIIRKATPPGAKHSPQWRKLTTKQRIELCRELAKTLRRVK